MSSFRLCSIGEERASYFGKPCTSNTEEIFFYFDHCPFISVSINLVKGYFLYIVSSFLQVIQTGVNSRLTAPHAVVKTQNEWQKDKGRIFRDN